MHRCRSNTFLKMLKAVGGTGRKKADAARLYACAARVFIETNCVTAGEEALVLAEGGCTVALERFLALLKTYQEKESLTIQADERGLRLFTTTWPIVEYTSHVSPPAAFVVGKVTDDWLGTAPRPGCSRGRELP